MMETQSSFLKPTKTADSSQKLSSQKSSRNPSPSTKGKTPLRPRKKESSMRSFNFSASLKAKSWADKQADLSKVISQELLSLLDVDMISSLHQFMFFDVVNNRDFSLPRPRQKSRAKKKVFETEEELLQEIQQIIENQVGKIRIDSAYDLKRLCTKYYERKSDSGMQLMEMLDSLAISRPRSMVSKRRNFKLEDENGKAKHMNFLLDFQEMRTGAKSEQNQALKKQRAKGQKQYFNVCKLMSLYNLENSKFAAYFTDHMRNVIETGHPYTSSHFFEILQTLKDKELDYSANKDPVRVTRTMIQALKIPESEVVSWLEAKRDSGGVSEAFENGMFDVIERAFHKSLSPGKLRV